MPSQAKPKYYDHAISVAIAKEALKFVKMRQSELQNKLQNSIMKAAQQYIESNPDILEEQDIIPIVTIDATPEQNNLNSKMQVLSMFSSMLGFQANGIPLNFIIASAEHSDLQNAVIAHSENPRNSDIDEVFARKGIDPDIVIFSKTEDAKTFFTFQAWKGIKSLWDDVTLKIPDKAIDTSIARTIEAKLKTLGARPNIESGFDFEVPRQVKATHKPNGRHLH